VISSTGQPPSGNQKFCVDPGPCKDCEKQTYVENGVVTCAPEGTVTDAGISPPVCECKSPIGCRSPCYNVTCSSGLACVEKGPSKGTCQPVDNCNFFPCGPGLACLDTKCIDDPCDPNPCKADEVCKPADPTTLTGHKCVGSCANVTCKDTEKCVDGKCQATGCPQPCAEGEVCHPAEAGAFCWKDNCGADGGVICTAGLYCDPVTGICGNDPCTAVHCPAAQYCKTGECYWSPETGTDGGNEAGTSDAGKKDGSSEGGNPKEDQSGIWRLATGGGCACRTTGAPSGPAGFFAGLALAALAFFRRRGGR
jgi:MYXO-CTERM domain-containing protein